MQIFNFIIVCRWWSTANSSIQFPSHKNSPTHAYQMEFMQTMKQLTLSAKCLQTDTPVREESLSFCKENVAKLVAIWHHSKQNLLLHKF